MEQSSHTQAEARFERPKEGRSILGVAAAIANYFNIPIGLIRAGFVVSIFFGGLGIAAYGAGWVLIREEGEDDSLVERWLGNVTSPSSWVGLGLVAIAIVVLVDSINVFSGSTFLAGILVVAGILLYRGAFDDGMPSFNMSRSAPPGARAVVGSGTAESTDGDVSFGEEDGSEDAPGEVDQDLVDAHEELAIEIPKVDSDDDGAPPTKRVAVVAGAPRRRPRQRSRLGRFTLAALLISIGSMAVADTADLVQFAVGDYFAVALMVVGVGLVVGAIFGRAYSLILLGLILVALVQVTSWINIPLGGGFGDPRYAPVSAVDVSSEYRLFAGQMTLDLSDLQPSTEIRTDVSLGAGELTIDLPDDVNVVIDIRVVAGEVNAPDGQYTGTDLDRVFERHPEGATGTFFIDASVGFGQLNINVENR